MSLNFSFTIGTRNVRYCFTNTFGELGHECKSRGHPSFKVSNDAATLVSELLIIEFFNDYFIVIVSVSVQTFM